MRAWPLFAVVVAGCYFDGAGVPLDDDGALDPDAGLDDGGGRGRIWRDDGVDDFATGVLDHTIIEPWGAIGPTAWLTGGVLARGSDAELFTGLDGDRWATLAAATADGVGFSELSPRDYRHDRPRGVGVSGGDTWTLWLEGEVLLDAGDHAWMLRADDRAFVELAAPGTDTFTRVVSATHDGVRTGTHVVTTAGWHRLRVAVAEAFGDANLELRVRRPGSPAPRPIPRERLRVRADALTGLRWDGFDDSRLLSRLGPFRFGGAAFDYTPSSADLAELGFADSDRISMRWSGQVRIDVAGSYRFHLHTDDGQRLWIDGARVLDHWTDSPEDHTTEPIALDVGWHDLIADLTDDTGGQGIQLEIVEGPAGAGAQVPADRLRPVAPRRERATGAAGATAAIVDGGQVSVDLEIDAPTGAIAGAIELGATIEHARWADLEIAAIAPDGTAHVLIAEGSSTLVGTHTQRWTVATPTAPAGGTWRLRVRDSVATIGGTIRSTTITVRYRGGEAPITPRGSFVSAIEDLGAVIAIDAVRWGARAAAGTAVAIEIRTCDEATACAQQAWTAVSSSGERPAVTARRFAQYRVELISDGDAVPALEWIELVHRVAE